MNIPVLKIRDENGNLIPINAIRGDNGKSAYEQAKEGGYRGTEEEFINFLNGTIGSDNSSHTNDFDNPHNVTAEQTGAVPSGYELSADLNTELMSGGNKIKVCAYNSETLNSPYKEGVTDLVHGMVITNAHSSEYATQLCLPSGSNRAFIRALNGQGVQPWKEVAFFDDVKESDEYLTQYIDGQIAYVESTAEGINNLINDEIMPTLEVKTDIVTGSYEGTGTYGENNPTRIPFDKPPKMIIISATGTTDSVVFTYGKPYITTSCSKSASASADDFGRVGCSNGVTWGDNYVEWFLQTTNISTSEIIRARCQLNEGTAVYEYALVY